jgi:hypothetical protein
MKVATVLDDVSHSSRLRHIVCQCTQVALCQIIEVGHFYVYVCGVYTVCLVGDFTHIQSYTVCVYGSVQPYSQACTRLVVRSCTRLVVRSCTRLVLRSCTRLVVCLCMRLVVRQSGSKKHTCLVS